MYYIIETTYTGLNQEQHTDATQIDISTTPAMTNQSHEERINGWCGTTDDWAVYAHGEYDTIEAARQAIIAKWEHVRYSDPNGDAYTSDDPDVIETCKPGQYEPMSVRHRRLVIRWRDIRHHGRHDGRPACLVDDYESMAHDQGYTLDSDALDILTEYRDRKRFNKIIKLIEG